MTKKKKNLIAGYEFLGTGLNPAEFKEAYKRFIKYQKHYSLENLNELQLLDELVFREAIQERYKIKIKSIDDKNEKADKDIIPSRILSQMDENLERIMTLQERLGFYRNQEVSDAFKYLDTLKKKFKVYQQEHLEEFQTTCPFCSEIFFLNIRTDKYKASKLKLYKNKVLCNDHLWSCYKKGKLTKTDVSSILNTSEDYVDFLEKNIYDKNSN